MKNRSTILTKIALASSLAAILAASVTACSPAAEKTAAPTTAPGVEKTADEALKTIEGFVEATTSDAVAADLPDKATADTFAPALNYVDLGSSDTAKAKKAITDFALQKVADPKVKYTAAVNTADIVIDGDNATVPADKVTINADGNKSGASDNLAKHTTTLKYTDGSWKLVFPKETPASAPASETATPAPSATN